MILGISKSTLFSDRSRAPQKMPPCYRVPGRRGLLWRRHEVVEWVQRFPEPRNEFLASAPASHRSRFGLRAAIGKTHSFDRVSRARAEPSE